MLIRLLPIATTPSERDQRVSKRQRRCRRGLSADCRFIAVFPALVMETDLVRAFPSMPKQLNRRSLALIEQPRPFTRGMTVSRLPHFTYPKAASIEPPPQCRFIGTREVVCLPSVAKGGMFKNAATSTEGHQGGLKTASVVSWPVMLAAPTRKIDMRKSRPQLARWVSNHGISAVIFPRVPVFVPSVNIGEAGVRSGVSDKEGSNQHLVGLKTYG